MDNDPLVKCVDCGAEFEFTARERIFYQEKGWNAPRRCKTCRAKKHPAAANAYNHGDANDRTSSAETSGNVADAAVPAMKFKVNCSTCGVETAVPFKPDPKRPVYCKSCLTKSKAARK